MDNFNIDTTINTLINKFYNYFHDNPGRFFISPGRLEIIGNHTDHNNGTALVAGASLYVKAGVMETYDDLITLYSEGHDLYRVRVCRSEPNKDGYCTTDSLIKGIINGFIKRGYNVGGFTCYCFSEVLEGSGISSSAAFEMLICTIINSLFNNGIVDKITMVKIAQEAESLYFGKPCGLLDQIGSAFGGISYIDFKDINNPTVTNTQFNFDLKILLTNPGGSHAGLTDYYASIPNDMHHVAEMLGKKVLREIDELDFYNYIKNYPTNISEREKNRAIHFYGEVKRVDYAYNAINSGDENTFIKMINESGLSSSNTLCNTLVHDRYLNSPERALEIARKVAPSSGHRVHGGGFMGTIISFCKADEYNLLKSEMQKTFGENSVMDVYISPFGSKEILH